MRSNALNLDPYLASKFLHDNEEALRTLEPVKYLDDTRNVGNLLHESHFKWNLPIGRLLDDLGLVDLLDSNLN